MKQIAQYFEILKKNNQSLKRHHPIFQGHTQSYFGATLWIQVKPKDMSCYGVDVEIISPTQIKFFPFDMMDSYYGGRGRNLEPLIWDFSKDEEAIETIKRYLLAKIDILSEQLYEEELERIKQNRIKEIKKNLLIVKVKVK